MVYVEQYTVHDNWRNTSPPDVLEYVVAEGV